MLYYERKLKKQGYQYTIGVDEAGRGPLAGPVVAAAAVLKTFRFKNRIDDSKKLSASLRVAAYAEILKNCFFGIGIVDAKTIDRVNILEATKLAMRSAVEKLIVKNGLPRHKIHVIVDGNMTPDFGLSATAIVKGDGKSKSIACASILAKVTRDRIMEKLDEQYPAYGFLKHKGYPTREHRQILKRIGPSEIHRLSFSYV